MCLFDTHSMSCSLIVPQVKTTHSSPPDGINGVTRRTVAAGKNGQFFNASLLGLIDMTHNGTNLRVAFQSFKFSP